MKPRIIVIGRFVEDRVFVPALAGARRYAAARGWDVETVKWREARKKTFHAPLGTVGFVVEGSDLPVDLPPRIFAGAPVVFLNCTEAPQGRRFIRMTFDNAAISRSAFRELSANVPSAFAVVGYWRGPRHWSVTRQAAFAELVSKSGSKCHAFEFRERADRHAAARAAAAAKNKSVFPFAGFVILHFSLFSRYGYALRAAMVHFRTVVPTRCLKTRRKSTSEP